MATAILKEIFDIELVRTRDPDILKELEIVYDVGDGKFDHHKVDKEYRDSGTPYAACGLIWREFGREVVRANAASLSEDEVQNVFRYIDRNLIESIDASDNGVRGAVSLIPTPNLSNILSNFNPPWDLEVENEDDYFDQAVKLADVILGNALAQQISVVKAKAHIAEAFEKRPRPELLVLDRPYPWARVLNSIDREKKILFVIFPRENEYMLQTVRSSGGALGNRKNLPEDWSGKRDEELNEILGIEDAVFCHSGRFIAGAKSFDSIMRMAEIAIETKETKPPKRFGHVLSRFIIKQLRSIGLIEAAERR